MNKAKYIPILLLMPVVITLFFSCKKKADMPPVKPQGNIMTIKQLRALFESNGCNTYKFTQDVSLYAYVTMDASSGNIYKQVYLRDTLGDGISMKQLSAGGIYKGDYLRINLNGAYLDKASSGAFLQIDSVDVNSPASKVIKLAIQKDQAPVSVTIPQLLNSVNSNSCSMAQSIYDGQLIQLNDVQFAPSDTNQFYNINNTGVPTSLSRTLTDCGGLHSIIVYTSSFATEFLNKKTPGGSGSLIAVASFYSGTMQLTIRSVHEVYMTNPRCGVDTMTQSFSNCVSGTNLNTALPGWSILPQVGLMNWTAGAASTPPGFPSATNFNSSSTRNVMWLISPPIKNSATKNLSFQTGTDFASATHPVQLSVLISTDFNGSNLGGTYPSPNPAHWYDITSAFPNIENGNVPGYNFTNASVNPVVLSQIPAASFLSTYTGNFYIGFRYTGHLGTDSTQTFAVRNFSIQN